jgi:putative sterol carrier protein
LYKGQDENDIFLEHIATGKKFNLTKKSFDHAHDLIEIDTIVYIGLVKWQSEWWFSGIYFKQEFNADLVLDERNSVESRGAINFLTESEDKVSETLEAQYKAFLDFNNGEQIAFMASDKIMEFNNNYLQFFNNSLQLSDEEIEEARQLRNKEGLFEIKKEKEDPDFTKVAESGLVFFNPKSGIEIALAVNSAFPLPTNPFFNSKESEDHIFRLMMDESLSTELVMFCIENCKTKLPFFTKGTGKMYLKDIDFLLRFWKLGNYHSKPSITLV